MAADRREHLERILGRNQVRRFDKARDLIQECERVLETYQVRFASESAFGEGCIALQEFEDKFRAGDATPLDEDHRRQIAAALSAWYIANLLLRAVDDGRQLHSFLPHLRLLTEARHPVGEKGTGDQATDKLTELLLGLACLRFATEVSLDDPVRSTGVNPDVLMTWRRKRWAIACKVPNGASPRTAYDNIQEGISQIRASGSQRGVVLIGARNWIEHATLILRGGINNANASAWSSPDEAIRALNTVMSKLGERVRGEIPACTSGELHGDCCVTPAIVILVQTIVVTASAGLPILTPLTFVHCTCLRDLRPDDEEFLGALNDSLNPSPPPSPANSPRTSGR